MFTPCNAKPISLGPAPWNENCPKKYPSPGIPVPQLRQNYWNLSCTIPLGYTCPPDLWRIPLEICNSNMRFFPKAPLT